MTEGDERHLYGDLAWLWPILSPPEEYTEEAAFLTSLIRRDAATESLLHLGCGGGHLDLWLKRHFSVTGIDTSGTMLALARQLNPEVAYIAGDMRTVRLERTFDAVLAFDAINYMLTPGDLRAAFETAYLHLRPGGVFITLVERSPEQFLQNRTGCSQHAGGDTNVAFIQNEYDPDLSYSTYEVTFLFLVRRSGELEIFSDRHTCGIFPLSVWLGLLTDVGFSVSVEEYVVEGEYYSVLVCKK